VQLAIRLASSKLIKLTISILPVFKALKLAAAETFKAPPSFSSDTSELFTLFIRSEYKKQKKLMSMKEEQFDP
jgi:hypothetical protein